MSRPDHGPAADRPAAGDGCGRGPGSELAALLRGLASAAQLFQAAVGVRARLTQTELTVLASIRSAARTAGQLAETTQLTTGAITRVLDGLERRGYITRGTDPNDRRRVVVSAVAERLAEVDALLAPMTDAAEELAARLGPEGERALAEHLRAATELLREQTRYLREGSDAAATTGTLVAPVGAASLARLQVTGGTRDLDIVAAVLAGTGGPVGAGDAGAGDAVCGSRVLAPDILYACQFAGGAPNADVAVRGGEAEISLRFTRRQGGRWRPGASRTPVLLLNPGVPWGVLVRGGARQLRVDATGLRLQAFTLAGGAQTVLLSLGAPTGVIQLAVNGGCGELRVARPPGVPVDLRLRGSVGRLVVDGEELGGQTARTLRRRGDARPSGPHYELVVSSSVGSLEIERGTRR